PEDHIVTLRESNPPLSPPSSAKYGIDSPLGFLASSIAAPLYFYASKKGKFDLWDELLESLPDDAFRQPTLDVGCGRGLVLLKIAERKKRLAESAGIEVPKGYGIDLFITGDQSGNSPMATFGNAASLKVLDHVALHTADFTKPLPFAEDTFAVVTASLSVHNVNQDGRRKAIEGMAKACRPGGHILILELAGYLGEYKKVLEEQGWKGVDVQFGGIKVMFGLWPCHVLRATKPTESV
ncbi:methyltransferase, partial [Fusarium coicis]